MKKLLFIVTAILLLNACANSENINQEAASAYTQAMKEAKAQGAVDISSTTAKRVHKIFNKMRPYADTENTTGQIFNWQLTVLRSSEVNAWAMPGGKMVFYTGIVDKLKLNDDEIATVMGHEMAHALKEHGKKKTNFGMATNILAQVGHVALSTVIGSDLSGIAVGLTKDWALDKPYSRSAETEADEVGLLLMAKSGYNPQVAPGLWVKMKSVSNNKGGVLAALGSTHPSDDARQENLQRLLPEAMKVYHARR
ncbi:M48 family metallopeptidase [Rodentibacter caecimuris]|uniref:Deoxyribonuclease HsdR n=1 Tax=Rodentibacter caecimuris TaxID=1796644 RepID=A0ABX3L078_9PAST|nr:deoxyribonuclease HsdR [Rodentibacter heylii]